MASNPAQTALFHRQTGAKPSLDLPTWAISEGPPSMMRFPSRDFWSLAVDSSVSSKHLSTGVEMFFELPTLWRRPSQMKALHLQCRDVLTITLSQQPPLGCGCQESCPEPGIRSSRQSFSWIWAGADPRDEQLRLTWRLEGQLWSPWASSWWVGTSQLSRSTSQCGSKVCSPTSSGTWVCACRNSPVRWHDGEVEVGTSTSIIGSGATVVLGSWRPDPNVGCSTSKLVLEWELAVSTIASSMGWPVGLRSLTRMSVALHLGYLRAHSHQVLWAQFEIKFDLERETWTWDPLQDNVPVCVDSYQMIYWPAQPSAGEATAKAVFKHFTHWLMCWWTEVQTPELNH